MWHTTDMRGYSGEFSKRRLFSFFSSSFLVAAIIVQRMFVCGRSSNKGTPRFADHVQPRGKGGAKGGAWARVTTW